MIEHPGDHLIDRDATRRRARSITIDRVISRMFYHVLLSRRHSGTSGCRLRFGQPSGVAWMPGCRRRCVRRLQTQIVVVRGGCPVRVSIEAFVT